jgi:Fic family protein
MSRIRLLFGSYFTGTTKPTATRDLQDLVKKEVFVSTDGGRSGRYHVTL